MAIDLERMSLEDIVVLNKRVVRRIEYLHGLNTEAELSQFAVGDRVSFQGDGRTVERIVVRVNRKTLSVRTGDTFWTIHPRLLTKLLGEAGAAVYPRADDGQDSWN